ncbi:MAG: hypothetical protein JXN59_18565 [Anaerolineae bacterium]|nr:hypothetical protein [Anaerolineae bacterium]
METTSEALWEINNEYRKRLSLLMGHMQLLEQLLRAQGAAEPALRAAIRRIRAALEDIDADHHNWRHTYYYREPAHMDRRRMVDDPAAVLAALETFARMLDGHLQAFSDIRATMRSLPRPPETLTRVIKGGDLWGMCLEEIETLAAFDRFVADRAPDG